MTVQLRLFSLNKPSSIHSNVLARRVKMSSIPDGLRNTAIALADSANPDQSGLDAFEVLTATGSADSLDITVETGAVTDDTWPEAAVDFVSAHESNIAAFLNSAASQAARFLPWGTEGKEGPLKVVLEDRHTDDPSKLTVGVIFSIQ
jgi:hypothetical protein